MWNPEAEGDHDVAPCRGGDLFEMHHAEDGCENGAGDDAKQHRDVGEEAGAPSDQAENDKQHEQRNPQSL